jgi:antitoxin component YwqK of YwqJK toxin-antitoxin module
MEVNINSNSIEELGFTFVNIYPNPNNGVFELEIDGITESKVDGKLFSISGQLVSSFELTAQEGKVKQTIEMSKKLAAGTYYLGLYQNGKAVVKQFVKE